MSFISIFNFFQSEWKKREEGFGGILFSEKLGATVFVNRKFMEGVGIKKVLSGKKKKVFFQLLFLPISNLRIAVLNNVHFVILIQNLMEKKVWRYLKLKR